METNGVLPTEDVKIDSLKRELLIAEWEECGFHLFHDEELNSQLIEEALFASSLHHSENKALSYGAVLASKKASDAAISRMNDLLRNTWEMPLDVAREFADGNHNFVFRQGTYSSLQVYYHSRESELSLFLVRDQFLKEFSIYAEPLYDICIIRKSLGGDIRVLGPRNIAVNRQGRWTSKEYKYSYVDGICLSASLTEDERETIKEAMSLAVHCMSSSGIGGTIVIKRTEGEFSNIHHSRDRRKIESDIKITDPCLHSSLIHLLSQKDGATLVGRDGRIEWIGVRLENFADKCGDHNGGMRHHSAKAYSALNPDCIAIVVSVTGTVTVFIGGAAVDPFDPLSGEPEILGNTTCEECDSEFQLERNFGSTTDSCAKCGCKLELADSEVKMRILNNLTHA